MVHRIWRVAHDWGQISVQQHPPPPRPRLILPSAAPAALTMHHAESTRPSDIVNETLSQWYILSPVKHSSVQIPQTLRKPERQDYEGELKII